MLMAKLFFGHIKYRYNAESHVPYRRMASIKEKNRRTGEAIQAAAKHFNINSSRANITNQICGLKTCVFCIVPVDFKCGQCKSCQVKSQQKNCVYRTLCPFNLMTHDAHEKKCHLCMGCKVDNVCTNLIDVFGIASTLMHAGYQASEMVTAQIITQFNLQNHAVAMGENAAPDGLTIAMVDMLENATAAFTFEWLTTSSVEDELSAFLEIPEVSVMLQNIITARNLRDRYEEMYSIVKNLKKLPYNEKKKKLLELRNSGGDENNNA